MLYDVHIVCANTVNVQLSEASILEVLVSFPRSGSHIVCYAQTVQSLISFWFLFLCNRFIIGFGVHIGNRWLSFENSPQPNLLWFFFQLLEKKSNMSLCSFWHFGREGNTFWYVRTILTVPTKKIHDFSMNNAIAWKHWKTVCVHTRCNLFIFKISNKLQLCVLVNTELFCGISILILLNFCN